MSCNPLRRIKVREPDHEAMDERKLERMIHDRTEDLVWTTKPVGKTYEECRAMAEAELAYLAAEAQAIAGVH